ncbi:hypothetical protein G6F35_014348 [Rhizopus arrhizus]|nr:hypothetical protein G6F35_014348 [Rhizopus arrhizus]
MHHSGSAVKTNILSDLHRFEECRKQNEQYSRIIAKQELMIKDLNKKLTHLSNENEKLSKHNEQLETLIKQSIPELGNHNSSHVVPLLLQDSPAPPPKSPYRAHNYSKTHENGSQSFSSSKRPPELKLVSSNYSPSKSNNTNTKQIIAPQHNSPQLPAGLPNSGSRSNFSHRDLQEKTHNETTKPFQEKKDSNESNTAPSTPMLPRTPRFDSLITPTLNTTALNNLNNIHVDVISSTFAKNVGM